MGQPFYRPIPMGLWSKSILAFLFVLILALGFCVAPTPADQSFDLTHRYTPVELADFSKAQLIDLVISLQKTGELTDESQGPPPQIATRSSQNPKRSRTLALVLGTVALVALASGIHSHALASSPVGAGQSLSSSRRSPQTTVKTCNPSMSVCLFDNVTTKTCSSLPVIQAGVTTVSNILTNNATLKSATAVTPIATSANPSPTPVVAAGSGGATTTVLGVGTNILVSLAGIWTGCDNSSSVSVTGSNGSTVTTSGIGRAR